jgi:hypothetical protein
MDFDTPFKLPHGRWVAELDSTALDGRSTWRRDASDPPATHFPLPGRSVVLLRDAPATPPPGPPGPTP